MTSSILRGSEGATMAFGAVVEASKQPQTWLTCLTSITLPETLSSTSMSTTIPASLETDVLSLSLSGTFANLREPGKFCSHNYSFKTI